MEAPPATGFVVSYHGSDEDWAKYLAWHLEKLGYQTFFDGWDAPAGSNVVQAEHEGLETLGGVILIVSHNFLREPRETLWNAALARGYRIVPVLVEDVTLPGLLAPYRPINLSGLNEEESLKTLKERLSPQRPKAPPPRPDLIHREQLPVNRPGLWRYVLDRTFPRLHSLLTRLGVFSVPAELADLQSYLGDLRSDLEHELRQRIYVPLDARNVPTDAPPAPPGDDPFIKPVHQLIRQVIGTAKGGDGASAQISAASQRSKVVRNIVRTLLHSRDPLVLLGDPGTGKTMTLQNAVLAVVAAEQKQVFPVVPIYVRLGEFHVDGRTAKPEQVLEYLLRELDPRISGRFEDLHDTRRLIIFFDGMDEMSREGYGDHVEALSRFATSRQPLTRTLFSCRINDFSPKFLHRRLVLLPFDRRQMREYLSRYIRSWPIHVSGESFSLRQLTRRLWADPLPVDPRNPFVLWLLRFYLLVKQSWPTSRPGLLAFYCRQTYETKREQAGKDLPAFQALDRPFTGLGCVAYLLLERNLGTSTTLSQLRQNLGDLDVDSLVQVGVRCGFLSQTREGGSQLMRFAHHRLQEFFAARHILKARIEIDWLAALDAPRWQETLVNYVLMGGKPRALDTLADTIVERIGAIETQIEERERRKKESEAKKEQTEQTIEELEANNKTEEEKAEEQAVSATDMERPEPDAVTADEQELANGSTIEENESPLMSDEEEILLSDRVELLSRIIRQGTESMRERLVPPFKRAVAVLAEHGNPSTQVKMMWACQNASDASVSDALIKPLDSPIAWVRNQALMVLAGDTTGTPRIGSDPATEIGLDLARGTLLSHLPGHLKAVSASGRRDYWASLAIAVLCHLGFLLGLLFIAVGGYYAAIRWLPQVATYDEAVRWLAQIVTYSDPIWFWSYLALIGAAGALGLAFTPQALWAVVLGTAVGSLYVVLVGPNLWSASFSEFMVFVAAGVLGGWIAFGALALLAMLVQFPLIAVYLLATTRIRAVHRSPRLFFSAAFYGKGYNLALETTWSLVGPMGGWILFAFAVVLFLGWLTPLVTGAFLWIGEVSGLPFHPYVNSLIIMVAGILLLGGMVVLWLKHRQPYRLKAVSRIAASALQSALSFAPLLLFYAFLMRLLGFVGIFLVPLLTWLEEFGVGIFLVRLLTVLFGILGIGLLLFILWYVLRSGLATLAFLRRPYPPDSFTPQQWLELLSDASAHAQDQILRRTTHQALGLDAKEFLDVLREARSIVQADPALGTYWRMRHDLEQILKQERRGYNPTGP